MKKTQKYYSNLKNLQKVYYLNNNNILYFSYKINHISEVPPKSPKSGLQSIVLYWVLYGVLYCGVVTLFPGATFTLTDICG